MPTHPPTTPYTLPLALAPPLILTLTLTRTRTPTLTLTPKQGAISTASNHWTRTLRELRQPNSREPSPASPPSPSSPPDPLAAALADPGHTLQLLTLPLPYPYPYP